MGVLVIFLSVGSFLLYQGVGTEKVTVFVMEGDSVTLNTGVKKTQQDGMKWYFNDTRIAHINGDLSKTCTDVQCNEGTEIFRYRLNLDHQTGSLTITNTRNTDSGEYQLLITSGGSYREKIFSVAVRDSGLSPAVPDSGLSPGVPDSGQSSAVVAGIIVVAVVLLVFVAAAAGVIYRRHRSIRNDMGKNSRVSFL